MTVFLHTIKRIVRNKIALFFILLFPLAFSTMGLIDENMSIKAGVIDLDRTPLSAALHRSLESQTAIVAVSVDDFESKLRTMKADVVVVLDEGFTEHLIAGRAGGMSVYTVRESNIAMPIQAFLRNWMSHAKLIASASGGDELKFYSLFDSYNQNGYLQVHNHNLLDDDIMKTRAVLGFLVVSMLYTSIVISLYLIMNRNNHTLYRTIAAPVRLRSYALQIVGSFVFVLVIQITFSMLMFTGVYGLPMDGHSAWSIYLLLLVFSLVTVALGVAISSLSRTIVQACIIGICLAAPLAMLGGAYFPTDSLSEPIRMIGLFDPVHWVMDGIQRLLIGESLFSLGGHIGLLLLFSLVLFLVGVARKVDISR